MSDKIITEIVLEGEKEAIASIQRVGKAADATFADLKNVQLNFDFIEPQKGLKSLTDAGQRFASSMKNTGNIVTNVFAGISSAFRNAGTIGGGVFSELTRSLQATSLMAKTAGVQIPAWPHRFGARPYRRLLQRRRADSGDEYDRLRTGCRGDRPKIERLGAGRLQSGAEYRRHGPHGY